MRRKGSTRGRTASPPVRDSLRTMTSAPSILTAPLETSRFVCVCVWAERGVCDLMGWGFVCVR
jgi:hypothetical protein